MNYTIVNGELYHHGVKGMKWGVRRSQAKLDRLAGRVKKLEDKRKEAKVTKGVTSRAYRDTSVDLFLARQKHRLQKAKMEKDDVNKVLAKEDIKTGKYYKKERALWDAELKRRIFGSTLSKNEIDSIAITETKLSDRRERGRSVAKKVLSISGSVAISTLAASTPAIIKAIQKRTGRRY